LSFEQSDVSLKGNGPLIQVHRRLAIDGGPFMTDNALADWDLDIPRITTIAAETSAGPTVWQVHGASPDARCSTFGVPAPAVT
jgi:hypothetical protein